MCTECRQHPCHPRCPNAPEPKAVYECVYCKKSIHDGEGYYKHNGDYFHEECFSDAALKLVAEDGAICVDAKDDEAKIGVCAYCEEDVLECDDHWKYNDKLYHHDCLADCAKSLLEDVTFSGVAEFEPYEPDYDD